ncbi:conserved protein of unknown function (plasmid) [Rhodovastum atsumiense]|uniref:Uncharacterized protein n=1 Tax=Rhodovastum atsumiense TaxID=504468 RepID=A0A5M6ITE7_9PROT|nr:hypothetical protein [Rhodovastum atsumiense]KAA5611590.1 hypothetical protein F1189_13580 [Rhodovastum atsumiense]CAH2606327.1 conserved protein of unknown function [Rhodovastum atsumiense]
MTAARVICTLPHAAETISDVKFVRDRGAMISEELPQERAELLFGGIPGFQIVSLDEPEPEPAPPPAPAPASDSEAVADGKARRGGKAHAKEVPTA